MSERITQPTLRAMQIARITAEHDELLVALKRRIDVCTYCVASASSRCGPCVADSALIARIEGGK